MRRELLRYTDTDGDEIFVALDPVDDTGEDVLVVVHRYDGQVSLAARLTVTALRQIVARVDDES